MEHAKTRVVLNPYHLCMAADNTFCIRGHGLGMQPDVAQTDYEFLCSRYFVGVDGHQLFVCNEPTHCLQGTDGTYVFAETCSFKVTGQLWSDIGRDHDVEKNLGQSLHYGHELVMCTHGIGTGEDIDLGQRKKGIFYNFDIKQ